MEVAHLIQLKDSHPALRDKSSGLLQRSLSLTTTVSFRAAIRPLAGVGSPAGRSPRCSPITTWKVSHRLDVRLVEPAPAPEPVAPKVEPKPPLAPRPAVRPRREPSAAVALLLLAMSVASWCVIVEKTCARWRFRRRARAAIEAFWSAETWARAVDAIRERDRTGYLAAVAAAGVQAPEAHARQGAKGIGAGIDASEFITRALRRRIVECQAGIERGLSFLGSVGSTAPFIGLFGTVWGIYHALLGLSGATQVVLEKVAAPVGEALVMTAAGLFVAIPAVLAYNAHLRASRLIAAQIDGFAHDLHAYLTTGIRLRQGGNPLRLIDGGAI